MDVARVEAAENELDAFVRRQAAKVEEDRPGQQAANTLEEMWAESDRRFRVHRRLELTAEWYRWHIHLSEVFRERSARHEEAARRLLAEGEPTR